MHRVRPGRLAGLLCVLSLMLAGAASAGNGTPTLGISPSAPVVGDVVTAFGCGYQPYHWYEMDTYGPNATVDGPLDSTNIGRVNANGCVSGTLLNPATTAGEYSVYVYDCGAKGTGIGCAYGNHTRLLVDVDFAVS
jgi:hypothetical protein